MALALPLNNDRVWQSVLRRYCASKMRPCFLLACQTMFAKKSSSEGRGVSWDSSRRSLEDRPALPSVSRNVNSPKKRATR